MVEIPRQHQIVNRGLLFDWRTDLIIVVGALFSFIVFKLPGMSLQVKFVLIVGIGILGAVFGVLKPDQHLVTWLRFNGRIKDASHHDRSIGAFIPVKDIVKDTVLLNNGDALAILRAKSYDMSILDADKVTQVIEAYKQFHRATDFEIHIQSNSVKVNLDPWPQRQEEKILSSSFPRKEERLSEFRKHKNWIVDVIDANGSRNRIFHIIIKYNARKDLFSKMSMKDQLLFYLGLKNIESDLSPEALHKVQSKLQDLTETASSHLGRAGVESSRLNTQELLALLSVSFKEIEPEPFDYTTDICWEDPNVN